MQIVSYIPHNAYLVYGDAASLARVQALAAAAPHVQWEGAYVDEYKIHPAAKAGAAKGDQFAIQLMADEAANAATLQLIDRLKLAPVSRERTVLHYLDVVVRGRPRPTWRRSPRGRTWFPFSPTARRASFANGRTRSWRAICPAQVPAGLDTWPGWRAGGSPRRSLARRVLSVDVSDSGIDNGTAHPNHFGLYVAGETNEASRVVYDRLEGMPNPGSTIEGCDGHGNINAHIVGGYDDGSGFPFEDSAGYHYGLGVCPFVALGSSVIFDPTNFTDASYEDLMSQAYAERCARISNNSWGDERRRWNFTIWMPRNTTRWCATPNRMARPTPRRATRKWSLSSPPATTAPPPARSARPAPAKTSSPSARPKMSRLLAGPMTARTSAARPTARPTTPTPWSSFSGRGPCADGRQKPDLVAPGTHISGGAPQAANPGPTTGTALPCFLDNTHQ